ncbi:MAG TPA: helix-turn-helix transcriptional regulator [Rubrobacteraceae bacterium]|nr:helix-turn-helix transcriptional regulator [Rubrobacteraceae bacterium]
MRHSLRSGCTQLYSSGCNQESFSYGYEIMERLAEEFDFEQISPATVYRTLRQMEKEGFCNSEWEAPREGPARRMYSMTEAGEEFLQAWVEACEQHRRVEDTLSQVYRSSRTPRSSEQDQIP